jgi:hypothetical protein
MIFIKITITKLALLQAVPDNYAQTAVVGCALPVVNAVNPALIQVL